MFSISPERILSHFPFHRLPSRSMRFTLHGLRKVSQLKLQVCMEHGIGAIYLRRLSQQFIHRLRYKRYKRPQTSHMMFSKMSMKDSSWFRQGYHTYVPRNLRFGTGDTQKKKTTYLCARRSVALFADASYHTIWYLGVIGELETGQSALMQSRVSKEILLPRIQYLKPRKLRKTPESWNFEKCFRLSGGSLNGITWSTPSYRPSLNCMNQKSNY